MRTAMRWTAGVLALLLGCWEPARCSAGRSRRYLVYPPDGSKTQLILGVGVPIALAEHSLTAGFKLKYNYKVATNSSYYLPPRAGREAPCPGLSRWDLYGALESLLHRVGMDGHACMLRAVCEAARLPVGADSGYVGEVLHLLLTPSSTEEECQQWDREYLSAEHAGSLRGGRSCAELYPECPVSLLQLVSAPGEAMSLQQAASLVD